ncbi:hypothetical protein AB0J51_24665 [Micromonospora echinofusca]|uniref:hypothetical protein n=1 Tax=Micromonospora echinofusca TaxID=47858 RepID=UPI00343DED1C
MARSAADAHGIVQEQPELNPRQKAHPVAWHAAGERTGAEPAELFGVARPTVHRAVRERRPRDEGWPAAAGSARGRIMA